MSRTMSKSKSSEAIAVLLAVILILIFEGAVPANAQAQLGYGAAPAVGCFNPPGNGLYAAASNGNPDIWQNGAACGKFYNIQCVGNGCKNSNTIKVEILDVCANGCNNRTFELNEQAFSSIANTAVGVITIYYSPA